MEALLSTLKWSAAVGGAALVLTLLKPLLDKRYSVEWRYGVWLAMAVLLLLAPVQWDAVLPHPPIEPPLVIEVPAVPISHQANTMVQVPGAEPDDSAPLPPEQALIGIWLTGAALVLLYHLVGTCHFIRRARRWSLPAGGETLQAYEDVCWDMGLKKAPPLCRSAAVDSPMAAGLFRPRLFLPEEEIGPQELAFILRHELTHYRRRDLWYKLILLLAAALHWFNPLIWLLRRESEKDLELTCDDAVVAGADAATRRAYSETLLRSIRRQRRAVLSTHFHGGSSAMKERFRNILGKRGHKRGISVLTVTLVLTVTAASILELSVKAEEAPQEPPPAVAAQVPAPQPSGDDSAEKETIPQEPEPAPNSIAEPVPESEPVHDAAPVPDPQPSAGPRQDGVEDGEDTGGEEHPPFILSGYPMVWDEESGDYLFAPGTPEIGGPAFMGDAYRGGPDTPLAEQPIPGDFVEPTPVMTVQYPPELIGDFNGYTPTPAITGDLDNDGVRDTEIEINGQVYPLVWNDETGWFDPLPGGMPVGFDASGDYNGDGMPDSEVQINGYRYQITLDPEGGTTFTPTESGEEN